MRRHRAGPVLRRTAVISVLCIAISLNPATAAQAAQVDCGDTVTTDVALDRDLTCQGDGLVVAAPGITIDLQGFSLSGSGVGTGISHRLDSEAGLTVVNGAISGFAVGMYLVSTSDRTPSFAARLRIDDNTTGIFLNGANLSITDSALTDNETAIRQELERGLDLTDSLLARNAVAVSLSNTEVTIARNRFVANSVGVQSDGLSGVRVRDNSFRGGGVAVSIADSEGFQVDIARNSLTGLALGVEISGFTGAATVTDNVFTRIGASGLYFHSTTNLSNAVSGNTFIRNGYRPRSYVDPSGDPLTSGMWVDNVGLVSGNAAAFNAGHGIEAYHSVDGGGNRARGNRLNPQCIGVAC